MDLHGEREEPRANRFQHAGTRSFSDQAPEYQAFQGKGQRLTADVQAEPAAPLPDVPPPLFPPMPASVVSTPGAVVSTTGDDVDMIPLSSIQVDRPPYGSSRSPAEPAPADALAEQPTKWTPAEWQDYNRAGAEWKRWNQDKSKVWRPGCGWSQDNWSRKGPDRKWQADKKWTKDDGE